MQLISLLKTKKIILILTLIATVLLVNFIQQKFLNFGYLVVKIEPPTSSIKVDKKIPIMNNYRTKLSVGTHFIEVSEFDYLSQTQEFKIKRGQTTKLDFKLIKKPRVSLIKTLNKSQFNQLEWFGDDKLIQVDLDNSISSISIQTDISVSLIKEFKGAINQLIVFNNQKFFISAINLNTFEEEYYIWENNNLNKLNLEMVKNPQIFSFTPNGKFLTFIATADRLTNRSELFFLNTETGMIESVSFGKLIIALKTFWINEKKVILYKYEAEPNSGTISIFDINKQTITKLTDRGNFSSKPLISPDKKYLITQTKNGLQLIDLKNLDRQIIFNKQIINNLYTWIDNKRVITLSSFRNNTATFSIINIDNRKIIEIETTIFEKEPISIVSSPNFKNFLVATSDGKNYVLKIE